MPGLHVLTRSSGASGFVKLGSTTVFDGRRQKSVSILAASSALTRWLRYETKQYHPPNSYPDCLGRCMTLAFGAQGC